MGQACCGSGDSSGSVDAGASHDDMVKAFGNIGDDAVMAACVAGLARITQDHPYLKPMGTERNPHHLLFWVRRCREAIIANNREDAEMYLERVKTSIDAEVAQVQHAFRRFDVDNSGKLDSKEFRYMCAYIGWGEEEASMMDVDNDSFVTEDEFRQFVGDMGGLQTLFEHRRKRVARKQWGVEAPAIIEVGSRVRAYYTMEDGKKSSELREGQILELHVMPSNGVLIDFGFDKTEKEKSGSEKSLRQVVPQDWVFSDTRDSDVVTALREVGILEDQQAFWASIFPESEMRAVERLVPCQRAALAHVRANASKSHDDALPAVRERFTSLGFSEKELQAVLGWVQDLAPMVVHIHIDKVGRFLETDEYYRSQFETGTSCGALDGQNNIRKRWELELFGGTYEEAKPFERCKYGALGVMNDYRGVTSAYQYGDSYLVLKDVRLRCTFAATDSGGISGSRLAVLDKYAHVLKEYTDSEIRSLVDVALANTSLADTPRERPKLLRGMCEDSTEQWITVGFPDLPQKKGRYYFEVELFKDCSSPQVGFLSSNFVQAPRSAGFTGGVGDDEHGWAADGQHAILWHNAEKYPYTSVWPSENKGLSEVVVVGVAVDIDKRQIWFSTNGEWTDEPVFTETKIPKGVSLYPGLSLKGRAAFNFGPDFQHQAPKVPGAAFGRWPGMADGPLRVDCPILGNSRNINIYKEIQLHGEMSLKRNVQRLVANKKHLEISKAQRSWAIRVDDGGGEMSGVYNRVGARSGMPLYTKADGGVLFYNASSKKWCIVAATMADDVELEKEAVIVEADPENDVNSPPREGWTRPKEAQGYVAVDVFKVALEGGKVSAEDIKKLTDALSGTTACGKKVVFRSGARFQEEWDKLASPPMNAEAAWNLVVEEVQKQLLNELGMGQAHVVETAHPYETKDHSFAKTVSVPDADQINVYFSKECRTYDNRTKLKIYAGGLSKASAGVGARVHMKVITGRDEAHGTILGRGEGGTYKVRIDSDEAEICGKFKEWVEGAPGRFCTTQVAEEQKIIKVRYGDGVTVGSEISGFRLDEADPLSPFSVNGFSSKGPATNAGVMVGWYLDVGALLREEQFINLEGEGWGTPPKSLAEVAQNPDEFQQRLVKLREASNVTLVFTNGLEFQLLPQARVTYEEAVETEISSFEASGGVVTVSGFTSNGVAHQAGVRTGWQLDLFAIFAADVNKTALEGLSQDSIASDPSPLLKLSKVKMIFEPASPEPQEYFSGSGAGEAVWKDFSVPQNSAQFVFQTDGDKGGWGFDPDPKRRYGFRVVVTPGGSAAPAQEKLDELMARWGEDTLRAMGSQAQISVEPEDWDEARLRALCARHGWEFEWMTEEGERRRRIDGAERARKVATKFCPKEESSTAWWRLDSVAAALAQTMSSPQAGANVTAKAQPKKKITMQDTDQVEEKNNKANVKK
eukprot:gb/GFBE01003405.1/.p1 GENE.gb/GFBE01003405.1/~~gb/GFBE01003405.1/.p1  ORF type:complete len:1430 (+),score=341.84 gb/GFBE01003405.1/:1-4290(+)